MAGGSRVVLLLPKDKRRPGRYAVRTLCVYQHLSEISYWISKFPYLVNDKRIAPCTLRLNSVADLEDAMKIIPTLAKKSIIAIWAIRLQSQHWGITVALSTIRAGVLVCFSSTESKRVFTGFHSIQRATSGFSSPCLFNDVIWKSQYGIGIFLTWFNQSTISTLQREADILTRYVKRHRLSLEHIWLAKSLDLVDKVDESCPMRWNVNEQICWFAVAKRCESQHCRHFGSTPLLYSTGDPRFYRLWKGPDPNAVIPTVKCYWL
jgi:hypothetical protein